MSNKIFKSIAPGSSATIEFVSADGNVTLYVRQNAGAIDLSATDAPALCLAILEAAGIVPAHHSDYQNGTPEALEHVAQGLKDEIDIAEAEAKEAADREALESEAEALWIAAKQDGWIDPDGWDGLGNDSRHMWVSIARKARELHGGTK